MDAFATQRLLILPLLFVAQNPCQAFCQPRQEQQMRSLRERYCPAVNDQ